MSPSPHTAAHQRTSYLGAFQVSLSFTCLRWVKIVSNGSSVLTRIDLEPQQHIPSHLIITLLAPSLTPYATLGLSAHARLVTLNPSWMSMLNALLVFPMDKAVFFRLDSLHLRNLKALPHSSFAINAISTSVLLPYFTVSLSTAMDNPLPIDESHSINEWPGFPILCAAFRIVQMRALLPH
jgi:Na+/phosphate symporter